MYQSKQGYEKYLGGGFGNRSFYNDKSPDGIIGAANVLSHSQYKGSPTKPNYLKQLEKMIPNT
jgi:hypothetical protein